MATLRTRVQFGDDSSGGVRKVGRWDGGRVVGGITVARAVETSWQNKNQELEYHFRIPPTRKESRNPKYRYHTGKGGTLVGTHTPARDVGPKRRRRCPPRPPCPPQVGAPKNHVALFV